MWLLISEIVAVLLGFLHAAILLLLASMITREKYNSCTRNNHDLEYYGYVINNRGSDEIWDTKTSATDQIIFFTN